MPSRAAVRSHLTGPPEPTHAASKGQKALHAYDDQVKAVLTL